MLSLLPTPTPMAIRMAVPMETPRSLPMQVREVRPDRRVPRAAPAAVVPGLATGSVPIGVVNGEVYIDAIVCPMNGSAYGDSWGAPRFGWSQP